MSKTLHLQGKAEERRQRFLKIIREYDLYHPTAFARAIDVHVDTVLKVLKRGEISANLTEIIRRKYPRIDMHYVITGLSKSPATVETENFTSIFNWQYTDTKVVGYESYPTIKFEIAV